MGDQSGVIEFIFPLFSLSLCIASKITVGVGISTNTVCLTCSVFDLPAAVLSRRSLT